MSNETTKSEAVKSTEETVTIPKRQLDAVLDRLDALEKAALSVNAQGGRNASKQESPTVIQIDPHGVNYVSGAQVHTADLVNAPKIVEG